MRPVAGSTASALTSRTCAAANRDGAVVDVAGPVLGDGDVRGEKRRERVVPRLLVAGGVVRPEDDVVVAGRVVDGRVDFERSPVAVGGRRLREDERMAGRVVVVLRLQPDGLDLHAVGDAPLNMQASGRHPLDVSDGQRRRRPVVDGDGELVGADVADGVLGSHRDSVAAGDERQRLVELAAGSGQEVLPLARPGVAVGRLVVVRVVDADDIDRREVVERTVDGDVPAVHRQLRRRRGVRIVARRTGVERSRVVHHRCLVILDDRRAVRGGVVGAGDDGEPMGASLQIERDASIDPLARRFEGVARDAVDAHLDQRDGRVGRHLHPNQRVGRGVVDVTGVERVGVGADGDRGRGRRLGGDERHGSGDDDQHGSGDGGAFVHWGPFVIGG
jgi:hypothetical protein